MIFDPWGRMRKLAFSSVLILVCSSVGAVDLTHVSRPAEPVVTADGEFLDPAANLVQEAGEPGIPFECYYIVLPFGEKIEAIEVTLEQPLVINGEFDIPCAQGPALIGRPATIATQNSGIYGTDRRYPVKDGELVGVERLSGVDIAIVRAYPYKYNPVRRELSYFRKVRVDIKTSPDANVEEQQARMICRSEEAQKRRLGGEVVCKVW